MEDTKVSVRIKKAVEAFTDAGFLCEHQRYNSAINRLYYACFYITNALFASQNTNDVQTHSEVKMRFLRSFVKTNIFSADMANHYNSLYDWCQEADYSNFIDFDKERTESLITKTKSFIDEVKSYISSQ